MTVTKETFRDSTSPSDTEKEYKVVGIFTKKGTFIFPKKRLCEVVSSSGEHVIFKARFSGVVKNVAVKINDMIRNGSDILELQECTHSAIYDNICCHCGTTLDDKDIPRADTVSMVHHVPKLKVAKNEAEEIGKNDITNLLKHRKLVLLVDLDQTLIHTTNDNIPEDLKDVYHFQLNREGPWYHTRVRPHTRIFLERISKYYELHICTFGVREYAHYIARFLDPDEKYFGKRILSRTECLDPFSKKANMNSLFPCGDNLVCIIDDRSDVWNFSPNVIQVVPYHFFRHTGDINAPQGLQKKEKDDQEGIDFKNYRRGNNHLEKNGKRKSKDNRCAEDRKSNSSDSDSDKDSREELSDDSSGDDPDKGINVTEAKKDVTTCTDKECVQTKVDDNVCENVTIVAENKDNEEKENERQEKVTEVSEKESKNSEERTGKKENDSGSSAESTKHGNREMDVRNLSDKAIINEEVITDTKNGEDSSQEEMYDDFLLYLEDILKKIHKRFFEEYDVSSKLGEVKKDSLPDLKVIVPRVRQEVLKGVNIVFSGVVPQNMKLRDSRAYFIASCFGATVSERLFVKGKGGSGKDGKHHDSGGYTTHMVAANQHTEKVHRARNCKHVQIVTPNWLWKCAERWERVEERLFPLNKDTELEVQRQPPHHCFIPEPVDKQPESVTAMKISNRNMKFEKEVVPGPSNRTRTPSGNMLDDVNPLMFFSPDEKNDMADEVEKILSDDDDDDDEDDGDASERDSDEEEDQEEDDCTPSKRRRLLDDDSNSMWPHQVCSNEEDIECDEELPSEIFRQGGPLPSDDSNNGDSDDEGDLSRMGADLENLLD